MNIDLSIRPVNQEDFSAWKVLYQQYIKFYKTSLTELELEKLWAWFFEPQKQIYSYLAIVDHHPIGLVHFREYLRPIKAATAVFLDDLYVEPAFRGKGVAQELIKSVNNFCKAKNISLVRWVTAQDNDTAMRLYDKMAVKTQWITYDMSLK